MARQSASICFQAMMLLLLLMRLPIVHARRELIVGGTPVTSLDTYPWFAFSQFQNSGCGASLIHPDVLLTAAHCRVVFEGRGVSIGDINVLGLSADFHEDETLLRHPEYNADTWHHDIMLVKLQTSSTQPLVKVATESPTDYQPVTTLGFGATSEEGLTSPDLLYVNLTITPFAWCQNFFRMGDNGEQIYELSETAQICAEDLQDQGDACRGDSGGPLLYENEIVGLVSFGRGCGRPNTPAVYTRTSSYTEWIRKGVCELSSDPPTDCPSEMPSMAPSVPSPPTMRPSLRPTFAASALPSFQITQSPTSSPTLRPSQSIADGPMVSSVSNQTQTDSIDRNMLILISALGVVLLLGCCVWVVIIRRLINLVIGSEEDEARGMKNEEEFVEEAVEEKDDMYEEEMSEEEESSFVEESVSEAD